MKHKNFGAGSSSVLLIFVVLSLVTFGVLSYTTAKADHKLAEKLAENTTAYYTACNQAEARLAELQTTLNLIYKNQTVPVLVNPQEMTLLPDWTAQEELLTTVIPISPEKNLTVSVRMQLPENGLPYQIVEYASSPATEWAGENGLNLIQ